MSEQKMIRFRLTITHDPSTRQWDFTQRQIKALVAKCEGAQLDGYDATALRRAVPLLRGALRAVGGVAPVEDDTEELNRTYARLGEIADLLSAYARDEGGFSPDTREGIESDARFLRSLMPVETADVR